MKYQDWECKIVVPCDALAFDGPPRNAAIQGMQSFGVPVLSCFSGWGGSLTEMERKLMDENQQGGPGR